MMYSDKKFEEVFEEISAKEAYEEIAFGDSDYVRDYKDDFEFIIASNALYSYKYAYGILQAPFIKGEEVISRCACSAYLYAKNVLKGKFKKGEKAISETSNYSYLYAVDVLNGRFKKGENAISASSYFSLEYAKDILKGRFKKGERSISQNAKHSLKYAKLIEDRFPAGEIEIARDLHCCYEYNELFAKGNFKLEGFDDETFF